MGTGRVRGCWRETRRRETVSGQLLGSCPAGANSGMSHGRMLPVRRQLLLYKPWAAHRPLLHLHLSSPPRAEKPPAVRWHRCSLRQQPRLEDRSPSCQPPPQTCRWHAQAREEPNSLSEWGSVSQNPWERSAFRWGPGFGNNKKRTKLLKSQGRSLLNV